MSRDSKARIVLTGTPAPNGYEDIYNMFKFIWPNKNVLGFEVNQLRDITATGDKASSLYSIHSKHAVPIWERRDTFSCNAKADRYNTDSC